MPAGWALRQTDSRDGWGSGVRTPQSRGLRYADRGGGHGYQVHPYAAAPEHLLSILPPVAAGATAAAAGLTLPTRCGGPVASPELVRDEIEDGGGDVKERQWQVPVLELDADLAFAVLRELDPLAAAYGASVLHLRELAGFAADLVARGRLLPAVLSDPPRAVWRPVITGPDAAWARILAVLDAAASDGRLPRRRAGRLVRRLGCPRRRRRASSSRLDSGSPSEGRGRSLPARGWPH